jgi:hypothetical protein
VSICVPKQSGESASYGQALIFKTFTQHEP